MPEKDPQTAPETPDAAAEPATPEEEIARLTAEIATRDDALLRLRAELQNMQKRYERDRIKDAQYRVEPLARELLEVVDALDDAVAAAAQDTACPAPVREGQELIAKNLGAILDKFAITVVDPAGEAFDPQRHEAVGMQADATAAPGTVLVVLRRGYLLHDRLLRPARVIVCAAADDNAEKPDKTGENAAT